MDLNITEKSLLYFLDNEKFDICNKLKELKEL